VLKRRQFQAELCRVERLLPGSNRAFLDFGTAPNLRESITERDSIRPSSYLSNSAMLERLLVGVPEAPGSACKLKKETEMAHTSTYLNFDRTTEEAFNFYKSVFGTEFVGGISRMGDAPPQEGQPPLSDADKQLVMNVQLPILGGHLIMGTDAVESMGFKLIQGNNVYISLAPDTRAEADRLFAALSEGGNVQVPMSDAFWGDYFGSLVDRYGTQWMINTTAKS
jgi:PhnB protein